MTHATNCVDILFIRQEDGLVNQLFATSTCQNGMRNKISINFNLRFWFPYPVFKIFAMNHRPSDPHSTVATMMIVVVAISTLIGVVSSLTTSAFVVVFALSLHLRWGFSLAESVMMSTFASWFVYWLIHRWVGPFMAQADRMVGDS